MEDNGTHITPNLDMANERDRGLLRRAIGGEGSHRKRWPIPDAIKAKAAEKLDAALDKVDSIEDAKDYVNSVSSCVRTLGMLEGQNQADDHLAVKVEIGEKVNVHDARNPAADLVQQHPRAALLLSNLAAELGMLGQTVGNTTTPEAGSSLNGHHNGNGHNGNGKH